MVLEMIDAEALREMLSHSPWGRQFLEALFGQPDMFDAQVASGVPIEQGGDAVTTVGDQSVEIASAETLARFQEPITPPGPDAFDNPRGYLEYLKYKLNNDIEALRYYNDQIVGNSVITHPDGRQEVVEQAGGALDQWIDRYESVLQDIDRELNRFGGPRAGELSRLYKEAVVIRGDMGLA